MNLYALAADAVVVVHLLYVSFTVGGTLLILAGGILKWRRVRNRVFRIIHLVSVVLVAAEALAGIWCPLTVWERQLRVRAGQYVEADLSFTARLIRRIIFVDIPDWGFIAMYVGFAVLVAAVYVWVRPEKPGRKNC